MAQDRGRAKSWGNGIVLKCLLREGLDRLCFLLLMNSVIQSRILQIFGIPIIPITPIFWLERHNEHGNERAELSLGPSS